ncbi:MAG TPA: hypothetical protein VIH48_02490 [Candidatus Bathyarchaeia archaeon]
MKKADHITGHFCAEYLTTVTTPLKSGDQERCNASFSIRFSCRKV